MIPEYGTTITIQELDKFNSTDELKLVKELLEESSNGHIWYFDRWGNICSPAAEDELPLEYQLDEHYYIELRDYDVNQDNFMPLIVYCYSIYKQGYQADKGILTNNLAYTDPRDCLDAARWIIYRYETELDKYYKTADLTTEEFKEEIFRFDETNKESNLPTINSDIIIDEIPLDILSEYLIDNITYIPRPKPNLNLIDKPYILSRNKKFNPKCRR